MVAKYQVGWRQYRFFTYIKCGQAANPTNNNMSTEHQFPEFALQSNERPCEVFARGANNFHLRFRGGRGVSLRSMVEAVDAMSESPANFHSKKLELRGLGPEECHSVLYWYGTFGHYFARLDAAVRSCGLTNDGIALMLVDYQKLIEELRQSDALSLLYETLFPVYRIMRLKGYKCYDLSS